MSFTIPGSPYFLKFDERGTSGYVPPVWHLMPPLTNYDTHGIQPIKWAYGHVLGQKEGVTYVDCHQVSGGDILLMRTCFVCVSTNVATVHDYISGKVVASFACGAFKSFSEDNEFCCFWHEGLPWAFNTITHSIVRYRQHVTTKYHISGLMYTEIEGIEDMQIYKNYLFIYTKIKNFKLAEGMLCIQKLTLMHCVAENCYVYEISEPKKKKTMC